jgi:hypothetical protein
MVPRYARQACPCLGDHRHSRDTQVQWAVGKDCTGQDRAGQGRAAQEERTGKGRVREGSLMRQCQSITD